MAAGSPQGWYLRWGKRLLDIVGAMTLLVLLAPVLMGVWLLVRSRLGSPAIFVQRRPGLHGQVFNILKFRTMTDQRDTQGKLLADEIRLTPFGRWLRSTSLDELPELWNILKGEMSFVGPRPLLVQYLELYSAEQARRHTVRPGLTGWAQVNGRNATTWEARLEQDVWYVDNASLFLDLHILCKTLLKVVYREGVEAKDCSTMTAFTGTGSSVSAAQIHERKAA